MAKLTFDITAVRNLVKHAREAKEHRAGFEREPVAALHFVKDDGIYLMSSGLPIAPPVYAKGYDPNKGNVYDKCRDAAGGDDFVEVLKLDNEMEQIINDPYADSFVIKLTARNFQAGIMRRPASP